VKRVVVNFLTYTPSIEHPRHQYALMALTSLALRLSFSEGELLWHIADDGSPPEHIVALRDLLRELRPKPLDEWEPGTYPTISVSHRQGYGGNWNAATQQTHQLGEYVLPIEEDWELRKDFDISDMVRAMDEDDRIRCIRLGYLGWTNNLNGDLIQSAGQTFLLFNPNSTENHVMAGHPRLETVDFEKKIGPWPEKLGAGFTELTVCQNPEARRGVCWPLDAGVNASQDYSTLFAHIGDRRADE
jgi:hypothetical protein